MRINKSAAQRAAKTGIRLYKSAKKEPSLARLMKEAEMKFMKHAPTLLGVTHEAIKLSKRIPADSSIGKALNANKTELVDTAAVKGTSESYSMYAYRRPRKLDPASIKIEAIRSVTDTGAGPAAIEKRDYSDFNMLAIEPPLSENAANPYSPFTLRDWFDTLPVVQTEGTTGTADIPYESQMIHVSNLSSQLTIKTPTGCVVDIYDLVPRFDIGGWTRVTWNTGTGYGSPRWCVENGNANAQYTNLSGTAMEAWDSVQFQAEQSQTFNRTWKVVKKTRLQTADGAVHRHNSVYGINKTYTYQRMAQASTSGALFGGQTPTQMIVITGYPTSSAASAAVTNVDIRQDLKATYHVLQGQGAKYFYQGVTRTN